MPERLKKAKKCGAGCCEKNLRGGMQGRGGVLREEIEGGGGMQERVKKMKCGGKGLREQFEGGGICWRGYRRRNAGGVAENN